MSDLPLGIGSVAFILAYLLTLLALGWVARRSRRDGSL